MDYWQHKASTNLDAFDWLAGEHTHIELPPCGFFTTGCESTVTWFGNGSHDGWDTPDRREEWAKDTRLLFEEQESKRQYFMYKLAQDTLRMGNPAPPRWVRDEDDYNRWIATCEQAAADAVARQLEVEKVEASMVRHKAERERREQETIRALVDSSQQEPIHSYLDTEHPGCAGMTPAWARFVGMIPLILEDGIPVVNRRDVKQHWLQYALWYLAKQENVTFIRLYDNRTSIFTYMKTGEIKLDFQRDT